MNLNVTIIGEVITFFLFVFFCMKKIWPPIITTIEKRQKEISDALFSMKKAKKEEEIIQNNILIKLKETNRHASSIILKAREERIKIIEDGKKQAREEFKKIINQAKISTEIERKRMLEELRRHISDLVIIGVKKTIKQQSVDIKLGSNVINQLIKEL